MPASSTPFSTTSISSAPAARDDEVFGYYLTEDDGRLLKVFPAAETLRYSMPFQEPHATYEFLRRAGRQPARARPSSSPTTAKSSGAGPRHLIMFIQTDG